MMFIYGFIVGVIVTIIVGIVYSYCVVSGKDDELANRDKEGDDNVDVSGNNDSS